MQLLDPKEVIRVQVWGSGSWKKNLYGTVIGTSDGIAGVLLDSGEYIDVPEGQLKEIARWREPNEAEQEDRQGPSKSTGEDEVAAGHEEFNT